VTGRVRDAVVVGAGPAGLAFAIAAAVRGLDVAVLERREGALDKACGEGVLPAGIRALERLGVLAHLAPEEAAAIREIRWIEPTGEGASLRLPAPGGLGIRRTALSAALLARAAEVGVEVVRAEVTDHRREQGRIVAVTAAGALPARLLVAADGLASQTRRREGLEAARRPGGRFGLRRHFAVAPWGDAVEVHFGEGAEAYVTPAGARRVGVAMLFEGGGPVRFEELLARFPALARRLESAASDSSPRGAGPFERRATARIAERLVLLGDAAGYVDAITGDGLALAFCCAEDLAALLPAALARGADVAALRPFEAAWRRRFRPYAAYTRVMLALARHRAVRRRVLALAAARPIPFEKVVAAAVG
jgi:2-polyprenyl-6-methoxyphenol hydroxylase-like FAD-dependent oxidoreductase